MKTNRAYRRPSTLQEVATFSKTLEDFGRNLRDLQHKVQRGIVTSKKEFASRINPEPEKLSSVFDRSHRGHHGIADSRRGLLTQMLSKKSE